MNTKSHPKGFTLVELAIVMVIVGLLIGGVLKGTELVNQARIKAIINNVQAYTAATYTFQEKYGMIPGDISVATGRVPNCNAANNCMNGNGDGIIGTTSTNYSHDNQSGITSLPGVETTMFWKHLVLADMIAGVQSGANPATPVWGATHPACNSCGGFHVAHVVEQTPEAPAFGHYFLLRRPPTGDPHPSVAGRGAVSPSWARQIDGIMDDGNARTGTVLSDAALNNCASTITGVYAEDLDVEMCLMAFKF